MNLKEKLLGTPFFYQLFSSSVGLFGLSRLKLYAKYLPYTPGVKILDLGCGPASSVKFFKSNDYLGIDVSNEYINKAKSCHPDYNFQNIDFSTLNKASMLVPVGGFNLILAYGLIHHLSNDPVELFFDKAYEVLAPGGHMVCFDGCLHENQSTVKKKIILADRGKFIRTSREYASLAKKSNFVCECTIEEKALLIPYSLHIMSAKKTL